MDYKPWIGKCHPSTAIKLVLFVLFVFPTQQAVPGARFASISWMDVKGELWLFGGYGYDTTNLGTLNDLWLFNTSDNWTWISGNNTVNQHGVYGTRGNPSNFNIPGCRQNSISWFASNGTLWLFGGKGCASSGLQDYLNDLWQYNPSTNQWTWVSGSDALYRPGVYGTQGTPSSSNIPGSRAYSISWIDSNGNLWLFGGKGYDSGGSPGTLNDLWQYNPSTDQWTWVSGSNTPNQQGVYGTQGTPSSSNIPGGRYGSISWIDSEGNFWLFGGVISDSGYMNDLWRYSPSTDQWTWVSGNSTSNQRGIYITPGVTPPFISPTTAPEFVPLTQTPPQANIPAENNAPEESPSSVDVQVIVPSIIVPVVVIGVLVGVLVGLRKKIVQKKTKKQSNPLSLLPVDDRFVPYNSVILENEIGAGSYGKVFLGKWRATKVAVKVGNAAISTEDFIKEAEFQMKIPPHPNIIQLLGVSIDGPKPLVILEYCNQGSLDNILFDTKEDIPAAMQLKIATGIARGLYHLHENNIVHRDLAARNILLNNGEAKISDFGLSRKIKEETQVGKTASVVGPLRWMAPESLADQTYSKKSDVWSFGIVLYEITARLEPHIEEDILGIAVKIRDSAYTPKIAAKCPTVLREIMEMCWQPDPSKRPMMELICEKLGSASG